jgi:O-antigen/teichoic acid export membrane protein
LLVHLFLAIFILIVGEFLGLWYINNYLNIPASKIPDAKFVLHFSILSAVLGTIIIPFQGLLTSLEKFGIKATFEILQSILNLCFLLLIVNYLGNKLRAYALLITVLNIIIFCCYLVYTKFKFYSYVRWKVNKNKADYIDISRFLGWTMFYVLGSIGSNQGSALILNSFFGTTLNAAYGVATRVFDFIYSLVKNLNQAAVPQIMKNYSSGNQERTITLIYQLSKFTFFIMFIPALPIMLSMDSLLFIWLKNVPTYSTHFAILMIIHGLISCLESGFDATIESTGKIKNIKIIFNIITLSTLPILYICYKIGLPPYLLSIIFIVAEIVFLLFQLKIIQLLSSFRISEYFKHTIYPVFFVVFLSLPQIYLRSFLGQSSINITTFSILSVFLTLLSIYFVGLNKLEKQFFADRLAIFLKRNK